MQNWLRDMGGGMGIGPFGAMGPSTFGTTLRAFSAPFLQSADSNKVQEINYGGKAILPGSVLDHMLRLTAQSPVMLFKVMNPCADTQRVTHCGVLEFSAEEGRCYLPGWIMAQLDLNEGDAIRIDAINLPKATYAKLKPQNLEFLNITNPRAMLEVELRKWACLTKHDRIRVVYNDQPLEFLVQELKPKNAVCIIECDVNLEFDAPEGYVDQPTQNSGPSTSTVKPAAPAVAAAPPAAPTAFAPFGGSGRRLDGKSSSTASLSSQVPAQADDVPEAFCVADYKPGKLSFVRYDYKCREAQLKMLKEQAAGGSNEPVAFQGTGNTIRKPRY